MADQLTHEHILDQIRVARDAESNPNRIARSVELGRSQVAAIEASIAAAAGVKDAGRVTSVNGLAVIATDQDDHFAVLFEDLSADTSEPTAPDGLIHHEGCPEGEWAATTQESAEPVQSGI